MFGTIRKHQTWLWAIIITLTIISFVVFFSPYSNMNESRGGPVNLGSINGERITEGDFVSARKEVYLRTFFMTGKWPDADSKREGGEIERDIYQWLLLIQKQKELGIHLSMDAVAQAAKTMMSQLQRVGINSPEIFINQVLKPQGFELDDLQRFVRHWMGIQEMIATIGLGGRLVTPEEIKELYKREHEEVATAAMFFSASNYLAGVTVPPEALSQYYTNRQASYRIPERVQVSYVKFELTNFTAEATQELAKMTNMDLQIDEAYKRNPTNFLREAKAQTLEDARKNIHEDTRRQLELQSAKKKAVEFATPLFDMEPMRADNLDKLAKEKEIVVHVSAPFDDRDGPREMVVGPDFAQKAFLRTPEDPFAGPIIGLDAVYVIAFNKMIPSEIPTLDQIRDRVMKDYQFSQALNMARQAGTQFSQTLTNGLAQGKTVEAICTEAKVQLVELPPFSLSTRELPQVERHAPLNQFKQITFGTAAGKASPFQMTSEGGVIVYVKAKLPIDAAKLTASLPTFANAVRQSRQNEAFNEWFRKEAEKGLRDTPLNKQQTPPAISATPKAKK